ASPHRPARRHRRSRQPRGPAPGARRRPRGVVPEPDGRAVVDPRGVRRPDRPGRRGAPGPGPRAPLACCRPRAPARGARPRAPDARHLPGRSAARPGRRRRRGADAAARDRLVHRPPRARGAPRPAARRVGRRVLRRGLAPLRLRSPRRRAGPRPHEPGAARLPRRPERLGPPVPHRGRSAHGRGVGCGLPRRRRGARRWPGGAPARDRRADRRPRRGGARARRPLRRPRRTPHRRAAAGRRRGRL
ncbi:MAG: Glutamine amidotransferase, class I, partial [uncultured Thermoleophilia bacterium]